MADNTSNRGFAAMKKEDPERQRDIAAQGGSASGGNFKKDTNRASEAGKRGAEAQPTEAKREGGRKSHSNS